MASNRKKKNVRGILIVWIVFILLLAGLGVMLFMNRETFFKDIGVTKTYIYTVNSNEEVNSLINLYFRALSNADKNTLQNCVTTPAQFDNMTTVEGRSKVITGYDNINCYYVGGPSENSYIVYVVMNISINGVSSRPLDIYKPLYVVLDNGKYKIDNSAQSQELQDFISQLSLEKDIQELYKTVKDDQDSKAASDPSFAEFMNKLNN